MERQLDAPAAALLARSLRSKGIEVLLGRQTAAVTKTGLRFSDGATLAADLVVCAVGVRPNAGLAKAAGLAVNRGVVVDDRLSASLPASTPSANAPSIAASPTASSSRPTRRRRRWPATSRACRPPSRA